MFQNILQLNPKVREYATHQPSAKTKIAKKHWKRNEEKGCQVQYLDVDLSSSETQ